MIALALNQVQKYYGVTKVLEDVSFEIHTGEKVGIVGSNGCGKSTLLKIMMGIEGYEKGSLSIRKGMQVGYLEQMPSYPDNFKCIDVLNRAFEKLDSLNEEMQQVEKQLANTREDNLERILSKYAQLQELYESLGGYQKEEKISKVCTGLKIDEVFKEKLFMQLSGGEKTTILLGKILLQNPDILLLDEPSNHLDLEAMDWLEGYLKEYKGTVIIVSHDRYFLDNIATKIVEIEDGESKSYIGNYTAFVKEKEIQLQLQMDAFLDQQKKIKAMEKAIAQLRDWGMRGDNGKIFRRAASMQKLLDKLKRLDKPILEREGISLNANTASKCGSDVIIIKDLCKAYDEKILLDKAQMLIRRGETIALIGVNGCGKSTMIKILLEEEEADAGSVSLGNSIKLGYLPQNIIFEDENKTVLECFRQDVSITEEKARAYLSKYLFFGEGVLKKLTNLSGGERSRLKLAILMQHEINFLVLDEPTNHLDIDSREELEDFLKEFKGTVLFISHDRYFINNIASRVLELSEGKLISYEGNYEYYKEKSAGLKSKADSQKATDENKLSPIKKEKVSKISKASKAANNKWQKRSLEEEIETLEKSLKIIEEEMNKSAKHYQKLNDLHSQKLELEETIEELMAQYLS